MGVLIISPKFYNYHNEIKQELERRCDCVVLMSEVPLFNIGIYSKFVQRLCCLDSFLWHIYYKRLLRIIRKKSINTIFVIRGYYLPCRLLDKLKTNFPAIKILYYQWDSVQNNPNSLNISSRADRSYTFDWEDSIRFNDSFTYLPLYYYWPEESISSKPILSDILIVSSWSLYRYKILREILNKLKGCNLNLNIYLYLPPLPFFKYILKGKYGLVKGVNLSPINKIRYLQMLKGCKAVLDIPSPTQSGASIRVIEALSMKKKIITTNKTLSHVLFGADSPNILEYDDFEQYQDFLKETYERENDMPKVVLSLCEWLKIIGI